MSVIKMPVKQFTAMGSPYGATGAPEKYRFFTDLNAVPIELLDWMAPNPREQNLESSVAKTIAASMQEDHKEFHLRNRGILLSAQSVSFDPDSGEVSIEMTDPALHGNIDGGHTLRIILSKKTPVEQYVEFEVITGLTTAIDVAEARNTSVGLDLRSMEEMKGSYEVFKKTLGDATIGGDRFFERVEFRMNQQMEERNAIDIRTIISILLMFNQDLFPNQRGLSLSGNPIQMYGGREVALKKFLELGGGDTETRNKILTNMSPIFLDVLTLWDTVEKEFPHIKEKKYKALTFVAKRKNARALFSNAELDYYVPQSILYPIVAAFRSLVVVGEDGIYGWSANPLETWSKCREPLAISVFDELKSVRGNANVMVTHKTFWASLYGSVQLDVMRGEFKP